MSTTYPSNPSGDYYYYYNPEYQPWPPTYTYLYPQPISDADVERIALRVVALLDERAKPKRKPAANARRRAA